MVGIPISLRYACTRFTVLVVAAAIFAIGSTFGPKAAADPALPIIVYHQIRNTPGGPPGSQVAISLERFTSQMRYLHEQGYVTLSANEVVDYVRRGIPKSSKIVAIHFDDGWKSSLLALPILNAYGFKASFWIIAGKGIGWPHMEWSEIEAIARNPRYDVNSHSMTHPWKSGDTMIDWKNGRTPGKGPDDVRWELLESRRVLTERFGRAVQYVAWPAGALRRSDDSIGKRSRL